ncbi:MULTISPECIES: hypothetical protein [Cupriavidus]|jgi:hypothetical protein|uniref:hypothetical protein n=1 Tax=Cupriavidus TaxID=106589 RepID=UPI00079473BE|nr:hypothetical protein [Cupriavidus metallidurans]KWW32420.1 hypothetical protein AU374_06020 [Cupriavidus metallidurans]
MSQTPLDPRFVRKLSLLCCHCVRNIAYYRVGFIAEDGTGSLKQTSQFGATVNGNMLDIAVLEWCKLFADGKARHHWKRLVRNDADQQQFLAGLLTATGINIQAWKRYLDEMRVYRDKFVAHLDDQNVMKIPTLEVALKCVLFLYSHVRATSPADIFKTPHLAHLPDDLAAYYGTCCAEGRAAYAAAVPAN